MGYVGESSEEGYTRLYFDAQLSVYVEIPNTAILHIQEIPAEQSVLGESYVWIQKDAELVQGKIGPSRVKAKFLEGPIVQEFMRGAQLGGAGMGQPMPQFGGPVPQQEVLQASFGYCPSANIPCLQISVNQPCISRNFPCQIHSVNFVCSVDFGCISRLVCGLQQPQGGWGVSQACMPGQEGTIWQGGAAQFGGARMGQPMPQFGGPVLQPEVLQASFGYCPSVNIPCPQISVNQPCMSRNIPCQIHSVNIPCLIRSVNILCPQQPQGGWGVSQACMPGQEGTVWQGGAAQFGGARMG
jgi:hypothetical protein